MSRKNIARRLLWKRDRWILMFLGDCISTHEQRSWASGHYQVERIHWQNDFKEQEFLKIISHSSGWTKFIVFLVKFILKNTSFVRMCEFWHYLIVFKSIASEQDARKEIYTIQIHCSRRGSCSRRLVRFYISQLFIFILCHSSGICCSR